MPAMLPLRLLGLLLVAFAGFLATACASTPPAARIDAPQPLFTTTPYESWRILGARPTFELRDADGQPTLVGRGPIPSNGFLASPREFGDFTLTVEVRLGSADNPKGDKMNSGIQIRSQERDGTVAGLQIEVDPTKRAWSGGVYDERGRAWLANLEDNEAGRAAFRLGEWNRYEIECDGPRIRTRVNGVPCAEWYDGIVSGLLAFQVHGGPPCEVAFRAPMIVERGRHAWTPMADEPGASSGERVAWAHSVDARTRGVRVEVEGSGHVEVTAADGTRLCDVSFAAADAKSPAARRLEVVWLEGAGAVLLDGRRVGVLQCTGAPARVRVLGESCTARTPERLAEQPRM